MTKESGDNPPLAVVDDNGESIGDLNEEFYDACNIDSPHKSSQNASDGPEDIDEFHDPEPQSDDVVLKIRQQEENSLTDEELEVTCFK